MQQDMTKGAITPMILRFMIPLFIGDAFQQLYNMADTIIVGRFVGERALSAVGSTGALMSLVVGFAIGITAGFTVLTSQRFGAGDDAGVRRSVSNGVFLCLIFTVILTAVLVPLLPAILRLMNTPESIFSQAQTYITIICGGTAVTLFYNLFSAYLRAVGNSKAPLFFLVFSACLNVGLDLLFIIRFHAGVAGAATATVLSQGISAVLCLIYTYMRVKILIPRREDWRPNKHVIAFEIRMGLPMALQYTITNFGIIMMQAAINAFGATAVGAFTAASRIQNVLMQGMIAMGQTMATFCGQNRGAEDFGRIRRGIRVSVIIEIIYSVIAMAIMVLPLQSLMQLFFSNGANISAMMPWANTYAHIAVVCYIPLAMIFIFRSAMEGCGYAMLPLFCGFTELFARGITAVVSMHVHSYPLACACDPISWLTAGIVAIVAFIWMFGDMKKKTEFVKGVAR